MLTLVSWRYPHVPGALFGRGVLGQVDIRDLVVAARQRLQLDFHPAVKSAQRMGDGPVGMAGQPVGGHQGVGH